MLESEYYLWCAGTYGSRIIDFMKNDMSFKAVIDSDPAKWGTLFHGVPVVSYDEIKSDLPKVKIVVAMNQPVAIWKFLTLEGLVSNKDFFWMSDFLGRYFWEKGRTLVVKSIDLAVTTICNMRCSGCQVFMSIAKDHRHFSAESVIRNIDLAFTYIDSCLNLNIGVGESLLNEELPDICTHIYKHYAGRYYILSLQTNGTVIPSDDVLNRFAATNTVFVISSYPENTKSREKLIEKLEQFHIPWFLNSLSANDREPWIDFGDPRFVNETDPAKLRERYEKCWKPTVGVYDGWLYADSIHFYAHVVADIGSRELGDAFDLTRPKTEATREELYNKIIMRRPDNGYISHCARCSGALTLMREKDCAND